MRTEIIDTPIQFHLHGMSATVPNHSYGEAGLRLMGEL